jgi:Sulfatase-modifying factor enzyme 1
MLMIRILRLLTVQRSSAQRLRSPAPAAACEGRGRRAPSRCSPVAQSRPVTISRISERTRKTPQAGNTTRALELSAPLLLSEPKPGALVGSPRCEIADKQTVRYFGTSEDLLPRFAWFDGNTGRSRTYPVGHLRPNQLGLFDVYGNVWEWVQDRRRPYPSAGMRVDDREDGVLAVTDDGLRVRRSGSFIYEAFVMRSAERGAEGYLPSQIRDNVGFRIARTVRND